jgi:hypothetical protein
MVGIWQYHTPPPPLPRRVKNSTCNLVFIILDFKAQSLDSIVSLNDWSDWLSRIETRKGEKTGSPDNKLTKHRFLVNMYVNCDTNI